MTTTTKSELRTHPVSKVAERVITISNGHRTAIVFAPQGSKCHAVGFCGGTTDAPVSRKFSGRMWRTVDGAVKAVTSWVES